MATESHARLREELQAERQALADAVDELRHEIDAKLRIGLPILALGAFGLGFVRAGGVGATARLLMRRSREGDVKATAGRFKLVK